MATKAQKEKSVFVPTWEGDFKLQALSIALKNEWRTRPDRDLDDLMQEAHIKFYHIQKIWEGQHYTRSRFANTFRRSLVNLFNNYAKMRTRRKRRGVGCGGAELIETLAHYDLEPDRVDMRDLLRYARSDVVLRRVVRHLVTGEFKMRRQRRAGYKDREESTNQFLRRVAKVGSEIDMVRLVTDWIQGESAVAC